jgi:hypothetical protein
MRVNYRLSNLRHDGLLYSARIHSLSRYDANAAEAWRYIGSLDWFRSVDRNYIYHAEILSTKDRLARTATEDCQDCNPEIREPHFSTPAIMVERWF